MEFKKKESFLVRPSTSTNCLALHRSATSRGGCHGHCPLAHLPAFLHPPPLDSAEAALMRLPGTSWDKWPPLLCPFLAWLTGLSTPSRNSLFSRTLLAEEAALSLSSSVGPGWSPPSPPPLLPLVVSALMAPDFSLLGDLPELQIHILCPPDT